jgi:hypothetical protein
MLFFFLNGKDLGVRGDPSVYGRFFTETKVKGLNVTFQDAEV